MIGPDGEPWTLAAFTEGAKTTAVWSIIPFLEVFESARLDSEHFQPSFVNMESKVRSFDHKLLGQIAGYINRGTQPTYSEEGEIPVLRTVNIREKGLTDTRQDFVTKEFFDDNPRGQVSQDDVLITSTGVGTLGRVTYNYESSPYFADGHITMVRNFEHSNPQYVTTFLQSQVGYALIERRQRGSSGQIEIYPDDIASIPIPLLPKAFQEDIAAMQMRARELRWRSQELYAEAEALLLDALGLDAALDAEEEALLTYTQSSRRAWEAGRLDAEYFQPRYTQVEQAIQQAAHTTLGKLIEPLVNGYDYRDYVEEGTPYIRVGNVGRGRIDLEGAAKVGITIDDVDKNVDLRVGDVLFTRKGTFGNAAVVREGQTHAIISSEIMRLRLKDLRIQPDYLALFLNSDAGYLQVERRVHGVAYYSISQPDLESVFVPILSADLQQHLTRLVQQSIKAEQDAHRLLEEAKAQVEAMILVEGNS